jgi:putative FmdB family regulatory protein
VPIYVYRCEACEERFEELMQSADDPPPCPKCKSDETIRLLSGFSTRWKPSRVNWHRLGL